MEIIGIVVLAVVVCYLVFKPKSTEANASEAPYKVEPPTTEAPSAERVDQAPVVAESAPAKAKRTPKPKAEAKPKAAAKPKVKKPKA